MWARTWRDHRWRRRSSHTSQPHRGLAEMKLGELDTKGVFHPWAWRGDPAPDEEEEPSEAADLGSECSCIESCFGVKVTSGNEAMSDAEHEASEIAGSESGSRLVRVCPQGSADTVAMDDGTENTFDTNYYQNLLAAVVSSPPTRPSPPTTPQPRSLRKTH
uniref:Uncharacterized protein n=1 Tax=Oryza brachyantha TaxID=4533 RepID=J3LG79_ORYBR